MLGTHQFLRTCERIRSRWIRQKSRTALNVKKRTNTDRALENFDDFYRSVYGERWRNMRVALLSEQKYMALVNIFGDNEMTCQTLEAGGGISVRSLVELAQKRRQEQKATNETNEMETSKTNEGTKLLDEKVKAMTRKQELEEIDTLYGSSGSAGTTIPQHLHYKQMDEIKSSQFSAKDENIEWQEEEEEENAVVSSFGQAIRNNDISIDQSRIIDPETGIGNLNEFVPATTIKNTGGDWIPESEHYNYYQTEVDFPLNIQDDEDEFQFPEHLTLYTYEMGNCSQFPIPSKSITGVLSHYLFDGASMLPPLLLGLRQGDRVLDACAAPGGKSLLMLQTLLPQQLICNDVMESRVNRIHKVMREYLIDYKKWFVGREPPLILQQGDARNLNEYGSFDKILVDVPCTTDRHSLNENDNNLFKPTRIKERLRLPELQANILSNCLRLLKPNGTLVYSTCSLSPVQNDGVVHMALQKSFHEWNLQFTINDLSRTIHLFRDIYRFEYSKRLKYGQMVIPWLPANYGPMYFSKITKNS